MAFPTDDVVVYDDRIPESSIKDINEDVIEEKYEIKPPKTEAEVKGEMFNKSWNTIKFLFIGTFFFAISVLILHTVQYPYLVVHEYVCICNSCNGWSKLCS